MELVSIRKDLLHCSLSRHELLHNEPLKHILLPHMLQGQIWEGVRLEGK